MFQNTEKRQTGTDIEITRVALCGTTQGFSTLVSVTVPYSTSFFGESDETPLIALNTVVKQSPKATDGRLLLLGILGILSQVCQ